MVKKVKLYKVTNTTIKPIKPDKNGNDTRTTSEKTGMMVRFNDEDRGDIILHSGKDILIKKKTKDLESLEKLGLITIEEVKDTLENPFAKYIEPTKKRVNSNGNTEKVGFKETTKKRLVNNGRNSEKSKE